MVKNVHNSTAYPENKAYGGHRDAPSKGNLIVYLDSTLPVHAIKDRLRQDGWQVFCAKQLAEMGALVTEMDTAVVILGDNQPNNESAYLTTKKLLMKSNHVKVVIAGNRPSAKSERMADFVGAEAYIAVSDANQFVNRLNELLCDDC